MSDLAPITASPIAPHLAQRNAQTLDHLHKIARGSLLHHHLKVGDYLLTTYFDGDAALYSDTRRNKEAGFDALLSQHREQLSEMGLKPSVLRDCVRAHIVWRGLPGHLQGGMDFSALVALAPVADLQERGKLAGRAVGENWTSRQIGQVVLEEAKAHAKHGKKLGRPSLPAGLKHALKVVRAGKSLPTQANQLKSLSVSQRNELHQGALHLRQKLDKLIMLLEAEASEKML